MLSLQFSILETAPCWRLKLAAISFATLLALAGTAAEGQAPAYPAPRDVLSEIEAPRVPGTVTLQRAISLAIEQNPELHARAWEASGSLARIRQVSLWPNPELEYERENFGGTGRFDGSDLVESTLSLAQSLPLGGDIKHRRKIAELDLQLADWDYHAARLETIAEVTRRFVVALAADRSLDLAKQELELAQATEKLTQSRVDAGDVSPVELSRVAVPVIKVELALKRAVRLRDAAYRRLSLSWGERVVTFTQIAGDLDAVSPAPNPEALVQYLGENPDVARWAIEISTRIAERRLAKAEAIPNLTGRFGLKRDKESGDEALIVGISLPLPLFDRGQAQIKSARAGEASARSRQKAAELRLEGLLSESYFELANAYDEAVAIRDRALPAAEKAYQGTQLAFKEGKLPFLDVLDAQRTLFELQESYLQALQTYHFGAANIESLIGRSLADLQK